MLLYQRFDIPDGGDWPDGRPVPARDRWTGCDVDAYRGRLSATLRSGQIAEAARIYAELVPAGASGSESVEIYTAGSFLWVIAPRGAAVDPLLERFREAGLLPSPPAPKLCPRCNGPMEADAALCASCKAKGDLEKARKSTGGPGIFVIAAALVVLAVVIASMVALGISAMRALDPPSAPSVQFSSARSVLSEGDSTRLSWSVTGASMVSIDNGIGPVGSIGSTSVSPASSTTYTLTATGNGQTVTRRVAIDVLHNPPKPRPDERAVKGPPDKGPSQAPTGPEPPHGTEEPPAVPVLIIPAPDVPQQAPPARPPSSVPPAPSNPAAAGELHCPQPVPPHGRVEFGDLPAGYLHFTVQDHQPWQLLIRKQPDGRQRLIMISQAEETLASCSVSWYVVRGVD